ncbi:MAG: hypothetical protein QM756_26340 [Polyangiaceae bacterium]
MRVLTQLDLLLALGADGHEAFRAALPTSNSAGRAPVSQLAVDASGTTLVARSGVDLVAVRSDGSVLRVEGTACAEPLTPFGALPGTAVLACRSGILIGLGQRAAANTNSKTP